MIEIFKINQTVFTLKDLQIVLKENNYNNLKSKIAYYCKKWYIYRIRKWIYVKDDFNIYELATKIYTPSYISFETVLFNCWYIYQEDSSIYVASYVSRNIDIDYKWEKIKICYRKLKDDILYDRDWILNKWNYNIADCKRALKDIKYLKPDLFIDNNKDVRYKTT